VSEQAQAPEPAPTDLSKVIAESKEKLHSEESPELSRKRGPGRPPKNSKPEEAAPAPALVALPAPHDEAATRELAEFIQEGCRTAAEETGFDGFKADEDEAMLVAKRIHPLLERYLPQLEGATADWALAIATVGWFAGKRVIRFKRWQIEELAKAGPQEAPPPPQEQQARGPAPHVNPYVSTV
jgi:hypothetical protein